MKTGMSAVKQGVFVIATAKIDKHGPLFKSVDVDGHVTICLVVLAEFDDAAFSGTAGLAALRLGQLNAEVVVVVFLLEAHYIEFQGVE